MICAIKHVALDGICGWCSNEITPINKANSVIVKILIIVKNKTIISHCNTK